MTSRKQKADDKKPDLTQVVAVRVPTIMEQYTRECLDIRAERSIRPSDVIEVLTKLITTRGVPEHIRSDHGPEFTGRAIRDWQRDVGAKTLCIKPRSPWKNGYIGRFNSKLRDELLDKDIFYTMTEVKVLTAQIQPCSPGQAAQLRPLSPFVLNAKNFFQSRSFAAT